MMNENRLNKIKSDLNDLATKNSGKDIEDSIIEYCCTNNSLTYDCNQHGKYKDINVTDPNQDWIITIRVKIVQEYMDLTIY